MENRSGEGRPTIFEQIKALNFPFGQYVVVGGAMEAHGLRKARDIDIVVTPVLFEKLKAEGWQSCDCDICKRSKARGWSKRMLKAPDIDILSEYSFEDSYKADLNELISNADVMEGVPFVQLTELLKWKEAARRPKDLEDIAIITKFLRQKD